MTRAATLSIDRVSFGSLPIASGPAWFCVRCGGARQRDGWVDAVSDADLRAALRPASSAVIEVSVADHFRAVAPGSFSRVFIPRARGLVGLELSFGSRMRRFAPTEMIARNLAFRPALERFLSDCGASRAAFRASGRVRLFLAAQFLLPARSDRPGLGLFRGSPLVDPAASPSLASAITRDAERWLVANLTGPGALPYKYLPSQGAYSGADNAIRRFLASIALARLARLRPSPRLRSLAERNLRFNLRRYFRRLGDERGVIVEQTGAKLGAAALAGLAALASPAPERFSGALRALLAAADSLAGGPFGFRTFFFPARRAGENWNFYAPEALLFLAEARRRGVPDAPPPERLAGLFQRCLRRHLLRRNPAFVPWATQAALSLYVQTANRAFARAAFEMSDWLAPMQQWDGVDPDLRGRFYDPSRPEYGPPHASSTGVYLEGLADAAALARAVGDARRASAYDGLVERGLRSLRQLQFRDWRDSFYLSRPHRVLGALRTEVYDNTVRIDNTAHALLAALKVLDLPRA